MVSCLPFGRIDLGDFGVYVIEDKYSRVYEVFHVTFLLIIDESLVRVQSLKSRIL